ncbi:MAG TPA: hypothetical protein GXX17_01255 [Clostridiales bacterium]|nr:hypothetical protein [Clostridiales bacterium]
MLKRLIAIIAVAALLVTSLAGCYKTVKTNTGDADVSDTSDASTYESSDASDASDASDESTAGGDVSDGENTGNQSTNTGNNNQGNTGNKPGGNTGNNGGGNNNITSQDPVISNLPPATGGSKYENFRDHNSYGARIMNLLNTYWYSDQQGSKIKNNPYKSNDPVTLWGYGAYLEGLGMYLEANPNSTTAYQYYIKALNGLSMYRDKSKSNDTKLALHCWADPNGRSEIFFDDNVWILHELIHAYKLFKSRGENDNAEKYLKMAEQIATYILEDGWDEKLEGGLYWEDKTTCGDPNHPPQKNTCINAPMAYAATELYMITKKQNYKDWAIKIYDWVMKKLYSESDSLFYDKIVMSSNGNKLDQNKYTYNVGNMISAAAGLYQITKDSKYLNDAKKFAEAAFKKYIIERTKQGEKSYAWYQTSAWFNSNLIKGYINLYEVDKDPKVAGYLVAVRTSLADGCLSSTDKDGYINPDWRSSNVSNDQKALLDQAATARSLFMIHLWTKTSGK